jgi:hypothetical protein
MSCTQASGNTVLNQADDLLAHEHAAQSSAE